MPSVAAPRLASPTARPRRARARSSRPAGRHRNVFLNVPFDDVNGYEDCFLAYVAGLVGLGLVPRSVLEIPSGRGDRLTRIFRLMRKCRYSLHDLSRVQLRAGRYPRFNMPFEAGMATALSLLPRPVHDRYVFATSYRGVLRVASDLGGVDVYEHRGRAHGVIAALSNAFVRRGQPAALGELAAVHRKLRRWADAECRRARPRRSLFEPAVFRDLVFAAGTIAGRMVRDRR